MKPAPFIARAFIAALGLAALPLVAAAGPVDINTADARTIARELTGVGLARAQAIVDYRQKNGPFRSADDLANVKGIGKHVVEQNRPNIRVERSKGGEAKSGAAEKKAAPARDGADE
jgi:competence protein ComEA